MDVQLQTIILAIIYFTILWDCHSHERVDKVYPIIVWKWNLGILWNSDFSLIFFMEQLSIPDTIILLFW